MIKARFAKDEFLKNFFIYFSGSMAVAVLNYLYHPIMGRLMPVEDFGEVQTLISLLMQLSIFVGIFSVTTVNITANVENAEERSDLISELRNISLYFSAIIFLAIFFFSSELKTTLNFHSYYPFLVLAVMLPLSVFIAFRNSYLQGTRQFRKLSIAGVIASGGRLLGGVVLVYLGMKSFGAIIGILIAQIATLIYVFFQTRNGLKLKQFAFIRLTAAVKGELKYAFLVFVATSTVTFMYTFDVVLVKHYFPPIEAGLYSGIATIARIIFFATGAIAGVLLPTIKMSNAHIENKKSLQKALLLITAVGGGILAVFYLFHDLIIKIMIGGRYLELAPMLPKLSLLILVASVINLLFVYFLALRRYFLIPIAIAGITATLALTTFDHGSLNTIVNNFLTGSIIILILLTINYAKTYFSHRPSLQ